MVSWVLFFFNDTATTEIYTLSLHDALPICPAVLVGHSIAGGAATIAAAKAPELCTAVVELAPFTRKQSMSLGDRKSTRLNSSHANISYAVFCLKKKQNRDQSQSRCQYASYH